jgi:hypothetical protein
MKKFVKIINMAVLVGLLGACASINSLTRAKTLPAGQKELYAGVEYSNLLRKTDGTQNDLNTFGVDVAARFGITDQDEVGAKLANTFAYLSGDYKRALIQGQTNVSSGIVLGGLSYSNASNQKFTQVDIAVPLYVDFEVTPEFTLIAAPKLMYSFVSGTPENFASCVLSAGMRYGKESGLHLEGGYAIPFNDADGMWQMNAGVFF